MHSKRVDLLELIFPYHLKINLKLKISENNFQSMTKSVRGINDINFLLFDIFLCQSKTSQYSENVL